MRARVVMEALSLTLCILCRTAVVSAAEVRFAAKPTATRVGQKVHIRFTVNRLTDVAVCVQDAKGNIVRHLAAGVLGSNPPAPLKPDSLEQSIEWDGRDDFGRAALTGESGLNIRVQLGMGVKLDGFLPEHRRFADSISGLATDAEGNLYVLGSHGTSGSLVKIYLWAFNREGQYLRELIPMPANLDRKQLPPSLVVPAPDKHLYPRNFNPNYPLFYPMLPDDSGQLSNRVGEEGLLYLALRKTKTDRTVYALDCATGAMREVPEHAPDKRILWGSGRAQWKEHTLVSDPEADLARVIDPKGEEVDALEVTSPVSVACHRKTGDIYVLSVSNPKRDWGRGHLAEARTLVKFSPLGASPGSKGGAKEIGRLELPALGRDGVMVLDDSAEVPVVWVGIGSGRGADKSTVPMALKTAPVILRIEDRGKELVQTENSIRFADSSLMSVARLAVHPETDTVVARGIYGHVQGFEGLTGRRVELPFKYCVDMGVGLDGNWYVQEGFHFHGPILRYDRKFEPLPVASPAKQGPSNKVGYVQARWGAGFGTFGLTADRGGRVYSLQQPHWKVFTGFCVGVFGPDGRAEEHPRMRDNEYIQLRLKEFAKWDDLKSAIWGPTDVHVGGIGVDWNKNIYLGLKVLPAGHVPPAGFEDDPAYKYSIGSVVKFKPEGGSAVRTDEKPAGQEGLMSHCVYPYGKRTPGSVFLQNAVRIYPGYGCMAGAPRSWAPTGCSCRQPMFQVDGWGRIFIPNAVTFSVKVVDNQGNEVLRFGHYGNADSRGPGKEGSIKTPEIPLGWPEAVGASHKAIYVADVLNRRIVRLKKTFAAEEACPVR